MTRYQGGLPTDGVGGFVERAYAFNGESYQSLDDSLKILSHSRHNQHSSLLCGNCWTPLEECYHWLRVAKPEFDWHVIRDPAVWDSLKPEEESAEIEVDGHHCQRVSMIAPKSKVIINVDFCPNLNYFPIYWEVIDKDGKRRESVSAQELIRCKTDNSIWLPTKVTVLNSGDGGAVPEREVRYSIDQESLKANHEIDDAIFTFETTGLSSVVDLDSNEVLDPATGEVVPLYGELASNKNFYQGQSGSRLVLLTINLVVIGAFVLAYVFKRRRIGSK